MYSIIIMYNINNSNNVFIHIIIIAYNEHKVCCNHYYYVIMCAYSKLWAFKTTLRHYRRKL